MLVDEGLELELERAVDDALSSRGRVLAHVPLCQCHRCSAPVATSDDLLGRWTERLKSPCGVLV